MDKRPSERAHVQVLQWGGWGMQWGMQWGLQSGFQVGDPQVGKSAGMNTLKGAEIHGEVESSQRLFYAAGDGRLEEVRGLLAGMTRADIDWRNPAHVSAACHNHNP